jgi:hypothetical protein
MHAETSHLADKTIVFSEPEIFKVVGMGQIILLRIFLQMKNPLLQNDQLPKHIYIRYVIIISRI